MMSLPPTRPMLVMGLVTRNVCGVPSAICQMRRGWLLASSPLRSIRPRPHLAQNSIPSRLTVRQLAQIILDSSQGLVGKRQIVVDEGPQRERFAVVGIDLALEAHDDDRDV